MQISDRYLLTVVTNRAPKASRTNTKARHAIAKDVRDKGGDFADEREIGRGVIELYSKGSINSVMTHYHAFNTYHQAVTCEYIGGRGAPRLISIHKQAEHSDRFASSLLAWEQAKQQWCAQYADEIEKAGKRLGKYFDPTDYPDPSVIAKHWGFTCNYMPIADPDSFELGAFSEEQRKALETQLKDAANRAALDATREYRDRLQKTLAHCAEQLRNGKRLHGSLLTNVQRLLRADLNVAEHPELAEILANTQLFEAKVGDALNSREKSDRTSAASEADRISRKLAGLF